MSILGNFWGKIKGAGKVIGGSAVAVSVFEVAKGWVTEKGAEGALEFLKALASGKGLENENIYGRILDQCDLKTEERKLLIKAIEQLRAGTEKEREIANNFVIAIALGIPKEAPREIPKETSKEVPKEEVKTFQGLYPGRKIIDGFIHRLDEFGTEDEKIQWIKDNVIHIGTDAHVKTWVDTVKKTASKLAQMSWEEIEAAIKKGKRLANKYKKSAQRRADDFNSLSLWKKLLVNK